MNIEPLIKSVVANKVNVNYDLASRAHDLVVDSTLHSYDNPTYPLCNCGMGSTLTRIYYLR